MAVSQSVLLTQGTQNIENNTTQVTFVWTSTQTGASYNSYTKTAYYYVSINGGEEIKYPVSYTLPKTSTKTIVNKTFTVEHDDKGVGSISVRTWMDTGISAGVVKKTSYLDLTDIPRASTLDSLSCNTSYFDGAFTYKYTPKSANFYNRLDIYMCADSNTYHGIKTSIKLGQKTVVQQTETISLSSSELSTIYSKLPNATKGILRFTLRTYSDSEYTTQIGNMVYKEINLAIPTSIKPSIGTITLDPVNITTTDGTSRDILVKGRNKITVSVSGCTAGSGSSIKSYTFAVLYGSTIIETITTTSTSVTFGPFSQVGDLKFRITVTDTRSIFVNNDGNERVCTCYDYEIPSITSFDVYRANSDGTVNVNGTYLKCIYTQKYSDVNSTNNTNVTLYYNGNTKICTNGSAIIDLNGDITKTYNVYLLITDNYGGNNKTSAITVLGQARILNVTQDGAGVAVGKMSEKTDEHTNGLFECAFDAKFYKDIILDKPLSVENGGTGATTHKSNAILTGNGTGTINNVATVSGALYATSTNGAAKFGILPVAQGGTGLTSNPSMLVDLASTTGYSVFSTNPRPGVTGTLPIAQGGTGATTADEALENLGVAKIVKLWENASHTSAFAAQTLTVNGLSNYDMVLILFSATNAASHQSANVFIPKEKTGIGHYVTEARYDGGHYTSGRTATANFSDNNIVFGNGSQNGANNTSRMIPLCIYGIKGVLS